jgi:hypothetical protein
MKYGNLRIVWSVAWGIVALLMVALRVRSYWWVDRIDIQHSENLVELVSVYGELAATKFNIPSADDRGTWSYSNKPPGVDAMAWPTTSLFLS